MANKIIGNPNPTKTIIAGVEMINAMQIGELLATKDRCKISLFINKANLPYTTINKVRYYPFNRIVNHIQNGNAYEDIKAEIKEELKQELKKEILKNI